MQLADRRATVLQCLHFTSGPRQENPLSQSPLASNRPAHSCGSEVEARVTCVQRPTFTCVCLLLSLISSLIVPQAVKKRFWSGVRTPLAAPHPIASPIRSTPYPYAHAQQSSTHYNTINRNSNTTPRTQHAAPKHYPRVYAPLC